MRRIACAANRSKGLGKNSYIVLGVRHFDDHMRKLIKEKWGEECLKNKYFEQGFVDNKGEFLNRKQAFKIAKKAGQIIKKTGGEDSKELFSEDLY